MKWIVAAVLAGGCGNTGGVLPPATVVLSVGQDGRGAPSLVLYRAGDGPWQMPARQPDRTYALTVTDDYEVLVVCTQPMLEVHELRATSADSPSPSITGTTGCGETGGSAPPMRWIRGTPSIDVFLTIGSQSTSVMGTQPFSGLDFEGTADVFAYEKVGDGAPISLLRRSIPTTGDVDLGTIDVRAEELAVVSQSLPVTNALEVPTLGEHGPSNSPLVAGRVSDPPRLTLLPAPMRHPDDRYAVSLDVETARVKQWYSNRDAQALDHVALLSAPTVTFTQHSPAAAWTGDMPHDAELWAAIPYSGTAGFASQHFITATASWLAATGATGLTVIEDAPGFDASWILDPQAQPWMSFSAVDSTDTSTNGVTVYLR